MVQEVVAEGEAHSQVGQSGWSVGILQVELAELEGTTEEVAEAAASLETTLVAAPLSSLGFFA